MRAFATQLKQVRQAAEDYEWYPTTNEIITALMRDVKWSTDGRSFRRHDQRGSFVDIGAGNGKVLEAARCVEGITALHAIEKSRTHLDALPPDIFILGVNFWNTTLMDKDLEFIFSNPPYTEFEPWTAKILREAPGGSTVYLVIPERWQRSVPIQKELGDRGLKHEVIGKFDFADAEDRTARAVVHLLKVKIPSGDSWRTDCPSDPFVRFFDETFRFAEGETELPFEDRIEEAKVVHRLNFIEALCRLYDMRLEELRVNYQSVCSLTPDILKEFEISRESLIESLRMKLTTAKKEYWKRLFDGMEEVRNRLTAGSRTKIRDLMQSRTGIEFNRDNAYAVVMWVVKNANAYFDAQLIETYETMVDLANVENYVSNKRVFQWNRFRYDTAQDERGTHFRLKVGHRMVLEYLGGLEGGYSESSRGISKRAADFVCDLIVCARNLGFEVLDQGPVEYEWKDSTARTIRFKTAGGKVESLLRVRAFFNRNVHLQCHPELIHAFNVQHGKLKGWLRNDAEAAAELEIPQETAAKHFQSGFRLTTTSAFPMLMSEERGVV